MTAVPALATTMDALATATGVGRAYGYPIDNGDVPCTVVGYPTTWDYDVTFGVGNARMVYPVWCVFGKVVDEQTRAAIDGALNTIYAGLNAAALVIRVQSATFEPVILGGITYMAVRLDCEVLS
jgi:hypothetical protein